MHTDKLTMFSENQALSSGVDSDNILDVGPGDLGVGNNISLFVSTDGAATGAMTVSLSTSDSEDMTGAVKLADYFVATDKVQALGVVLKTRLPAGCKRYLRLLYSGATGGTVSAGLVQDA